MDDPSLEDYNLPHVVDSFVNRCDWTMHSPHVFINPQA
jgi:hypothetical protein